MQPILAKEIQTLKDFSAAAAERKCQPLDFNGYKPVIRKVKVGWMCNGIHPNGWPAYGFGPTPEHAYVDWTYDNIPF